MCVIMAKKIKLANSEKDNWFLYKIRDRSYDPEYKLEVETKKGIESLFLVDQKTAWSEGVSSNGLMIVSAALDNHSDLDDNGQRRGDRPATAGQIEKTKALRDAISAKTIEEAEKILTEERFVGTSFISDGDNLIILEIYVNDDAYNREIKKHSKEELEKLSVVDQVYKIMEGITDDDYDIASHLVEKDRIAVRTNHGKLLPKAGYQATDDDKTGFTSSMMRYTYAIDAVKKLGEKCHPFEILTTLKNLKDCDLNPQNCPIRVKSAVTKEKPYYSSTIVMLTPTGTLFAVPLDSEVDHDSKLTLKPGRKVDFVMLPKDLPLFESFKGIVYKDMILKESKLKAINEGKSDEEELFKKLSSNYNASEDIIKRLKNELSEYDAVVSYKNNYFYVSLSGTSSNVDKDKYIKSLRNKDFYSTIREIIGDKITITVSNSLSSTPKPGKFKYKTSAAFTL